MSIIKSWFRASRDYNVTLFFLLNKVFYKEKCKIIAVNLFFFFVKLSKIFYKYMIISILLIFLDEKVVKKNHINLIFVIYLICLLREIEYFCKLINTYIPYD